MHPTVPYTFIYQLAQKTASKTIRGVPGAAAVRNKPAQLIIP
jgi:hypothetical protein